MSFWNTFVRVWQVRTSARIQRSLESFLREQSRLNELNANFPTIIKELEEKNISWDDKVSVIKSRNNKDSNS